jgi:hypothetical protein
MCRVRMRAASESQKIRSASPPLPMIWAWRLGTFHRFAHYRIRVLPYAGRPNWHLLATITPR